MALAVVECYRLGIERSLVRYSPVALFCVLEQDSLSSRKTGKCHDMTGKLLTGM